MSRAFQYFPAWLRTHHDPVKAADIVVYRAGDKARAVSRDGSVIAESNNHADVWQKAIDNAPDYGTIVGLGAFEIKKSIWVKKPLTIHGGYLYRSLSVGGNPGPALIAIGNDDPSEPLVNGPIIIENMILDGYGRYFVNELGQAYGEGNGAPGARVGIYVYRAKKVVIRNNLIIDHQRSAINLIEVSNQTGVYDHEDVIISNNMIINWGDDAVTVEASRRVSIIGNIMVGANPNGNNGASGGGPRLNYLSIDDVVIEGNIIDGMVPEGFPYSGSYGRFGISSGVATVTNAIVRGNIVRNWYIGIGPIQADIINNEVHDCDIGISIAYQKDKVVAYNKIISFRKIGIYMNGSSSAVTERNIVMHNYLDPGGNTPEYGIQCNSYATYNIIQDNIVRGSYSVSKYAIWVNYNICDGFVWSSTQLSALDLSGFPEIISFAKILHYDGTYYYLVIVDLINKALRKVQLS